MTPHDLVAWCLHSPKRLTVVLAVVVALGACGLILLPDEHDVAPGPQGPARAKASPIARAIPPASSPTTSTPDEQPPRWPEVSNAARAFLTSYVVPPEAGDRKRSPDALEDWATPTLWRGLRLTDPTTYPTGVVATLEPVALGAFGAEVRSVFEDGDTLELTLVEYDGGWRVADVQPGEPTS